MLLFGVLKLLLCEMVVWIDILFVGKTTGLTELSLWCVRPRLDEIVGCIFLVVRVVWLLEKCIVWLVAPSSVVVDSVWGVFLFR